MLLELVQLPRLLFDVDDGVRVDAHVVQDTNRLLEVTHGVTLDRLQLLLDRLALARGHLHLAHHVLRERVVALEARVDRNHRQVAPDAVVLVAELRPNGRRGNGVRGAIFRGHLGEGSAVRSGRDAPHLARLLVRSSARFIVVIRVGVLLLVNVVAEFSRFVRVTRSLRGGGSLVDVVLGLVHEPGDLVVVVTGAAPAPAFRFVRVGLGLTHRAHSLVEDVHGGEPGVAADDVTLLILVVRRCCGTRTVSRGGLALSLGLRDLLELVGVEVTGLNREVVQLALLHRLFQDVLLDGSLAHQPVDVNLAGLPDAMRAVLRLLVHRGVPIGIVKHDGIGAGEVDTKAAGSR